MQQGPTEVSLYQALIGSLTIELSLCSVIWGIGFSGDYCLY